MEPEEQKLLIEAAKKILNSSKSTYDYWVLTLPVLAALISSALTWIGGQIQSKLNFNKNLEKENYYEAKKNTSNLLLLNKNLLAYIYATYKHIKNQFNSCIPISSDFMNDYITEYNMKMAYIYQYIKIEYPGIRLNSEHIVVEMHHLEENIKKMNLLISDFIEEYHGQMDESQFPLLFPEEVRAFNTNNEEIIKKVVNEISSTENKIVNWLNEVQKRLGIDRTKKRRTIASTG